MTTFEDHNQLTTDKSMRHRQVGSIALRWLKSKFGPNSTPNLRGTEINHAMANLQDPMSEYRAAQGTKVRGASSEQPEVVPLFQSQNQSVEAKAADPVAGQGEGQDMSVRAAYFANKKPATDLNVQLKDGLRLQAKAERLQALQATAAEAFQADPLNTNVPVAGVPEESTPIGYATYIPKHRVPKHRAPQHLAEGLPESTLNQPPAPEALYQEMVAHTQPKPVEQEKTA